MSTPRNADELFDPESRKTDPSDAFLDRPVNTADVRELRKKAIADKVEEFKLENALRQILATPHGAAWIARLIWDICGFDKQYFHPSNSVMSEVAGRRSVGWQIQEQIRDVDYDLWALVDREIEKLRPRPKTQKKTSS